MGERATSRESAVLALTAIERAELARLRRKVAQLEEEQEILRKAALGWETWVRLTISVDGVRR